MNTLLIRGPDILTLDDDRSVLRGCDIAISSGRVVGLGAAPIGFTPQRVIDARDHLAMPGFFNAHTHAAMTLVRGWAEDLPLDRWFNERIWVAESALTEEDVYWGAALAACEMIRSGTVGFADHYFWMDRVAEVVEQSGLRATLAWCVFGLGADQEIGGTTLSRTEAFVQRWQGAANGRIHTVLGPHSPYVCSADFLGKVAETANRLGVGVHLHVSESQEQVNASLAKYGLSPVGVMHRAGVLRQPSLLAHGIYLTPDDTVLLQRSGATVVQCPNCHMKLAMGVMRVPELLAQGVRVALGTDGAASNNNLDMLEEARLAALLQKQHRGDPVALPGDVPLRLATAGGAQAMGFPDSGRIQVGASADLILFDMRRPHLTPRHNLVANVLHSARAGDISHVIVDGRLLLSDGELLTLDEARIMREAESRGLRMVGQKLHAVREYRQ